MILTYLYQMIKLTRAHIGIAVLPTFWLGSLFALVLGYDFNLMVFVMGFFIIFLIYASASYINDYYDFDADGYNRQFGFSGGSGVLQKYPQLKNIAKIAGIFFTALALTMTVLLAFTTFMPWWSVLYIGLGAFFSYFYSAPPLRFSYQGFGEVPHFIAGLMNAGWGYMLLAGTINPPVIVFAIPLSLHLLNVILIFEIPDKEADVHGGKKNFIVNHGRQASFLVITVIFWFTTLYFSVLALVGWYAELIDFRVLAALSVIPSFISVRYYFKKQLKQKQATTQAIHIALSLFAFSIITLLYFLFLQF